MTLRRAMTLFALIVNSVMWTTLVLQSLVGPANLSAGAYAVLDVLMVSSWYALWLVRAPQQYRFTVHPISQPDQNAVDCMRIVEALLGQEGWGVTLLSPSRELPDFAVEVMGEWPDDADPHWRTVWCECRFEGSSMLECLRYAQLAAGVSVS